jgi:hypothetical protein
MFSCFKLQISQPEQVLHSETYVQVDWPVLDPNAGVTQFYGI